MNSLCMLPIVNKYINEKQYEKAIEHMKDNLFVFSPYVHRLFPIKLHISKACSLVLSQIYLIVGNYEHAVWHAIQADEMVSLFDEETYNTLFYHMMDILRTSTINQEYINQSIRKEEIMCILTDTKFIESLRIFVLNRLEKEEPGYDLLVYLMEIRACNEAAQCIKNLTENLGYIDSPLNLILKDARFWNIFYDILRIVKPENGPLYWQDIKALLERPMIRDKTLNLPHVLKEISKLSEDLKYQICLMLEDSYNMRGSQCKDDKMNFILSGEWRKEIIGDFLFTKSKSIFKLTENMHKSRAPFVGLSNSFMNAGTTNDSLFRNNKTFISNKSWQRFLEYSGLGMIHQGNSNPFDLLREILPSLGSGTGEPSALLMLGLMDVKSCKKETVDFLLNWIDSKSEEHIFGMCMGLGLVLMASSDMAMFEHAKNLLTVSNTVIQESAFYLLGLVFSSTCNGDVVSYIHTMLPKIYFPRAKRAAALAISLISVGAADYHPCETSTPEELESGKLSSGMLENPDPAYRIIGLLTLGSANIYAGDILKLKTVLPFANDPSDDVKRATVLSVALITLGNPKAVELSLLPLTHSYNPRVRATAILTLGLFNPIATYDTNSQSGGPSATLTGNSALENAQSLFLRIVNIAEAMLYDNDDIVVQYASMAVGFLLAQQNPDLVPNYKRIMKRLNYIILSKNESECSKIGASIGRGLAELSGRSAIFSVYGISGKIDPSRIVASMMFFHSWHWYPLIPVISLCVLPTPFFLFNKDLQQVTTVKLEGNPLFYDYIVKMPEARRSRKGKSSKDSSIKDRIVPAQTTIRSGDCLPALQRLQLGVPSFINFEEDDTQTQ